MPNISVKAIQIDQIGGPEQLKLVDGEVGEPGPGQIRIRHKAVGLNFIDIYLRTGLVAHHRRLRMHDLEHLVLLRLGQIQAAQMRRHHVATHHGVASAAMRLHAAAGMTTVTAKSRRGKRNGQSHAGGDQETFDIAVRRRFHLFVLLFKLADPSGSGDRTNTPPRPC